MNEVAQVGLVDRALAALQGSDALRVDIDAGHRVTELGKPGAAHEAVTTTAVQSFPALRRYACGLVASK